MKKTIHKTLGYALSLGGFVAMFAEGDPRWQIFWTLGAGLTVALGCKLLDKAGIFTPEQDKA